MLKRYLFIPAISVVLLLLWILPTFGQVDTAWVRRYNGPGHGSDGAGPIAVDHSGNVYVTGHSVGSETGADYATIKYYPNGDTAWVRRYNGPGDEDDFACAITVDDSGNVYVTGRSDGIETETDYATIKYYPNGDTAWVMRYNGSADSTDRAQAIAIDDSGNVYVTSRSFGSGTYYDYATIKYWPNYHPTVVAPDSSKLLCQQDTIRFTVTATDPDVDDTLTLSGPGISTPIEGVSPLSADIKIYVSSTEDYDYVYQATNTRNGTDADTATWSITINTAPTVTSPDSTKLIPLPDTLRFTVMATDSNAGDFLTLSGPGIPVPINGVSPLSAEVKIHVDSPGDYDFVYEVTDSCSVADSDTATWMVINGIHGDANGDGEIEVGDVVVLIDYLYRDGDPPDPFLSGDATCDGDVSVDDVVYLISYLFRNGPPPEC